MEFVLNQIHWTKILHPFSYFSYQDKGIHSCSSKALKTQGPPLVSPPFSTTMTSIHSTHDEWHVHTRTLLRLQYMPPTMNNMYARVRYYDSSTCHPQRVTCTHEHATMTAVYTTHNEWHIWKSMILLLQYMPPTMSDIYTRTPYYDSTTCHPQWVTCTHDHNTMAPIYATHDDWHICKNTLPSCL